MIRVLISTSQVVIVAAVALALLWPAPAWAVGPLAQLQGYTDRIVAILEDPALNGEGRRLDRRRAVRDAALQMFDAAEAARRALGVHWRRLAADEQERFVRLFVGVLERSYSSKVDLYGGQRVHLQSESVDGDYASVRGRVITGRGPEIPAEARMIRRGDRWLVYDVIIEGVSLISNYRTQFDRIIRASSHAELMRRLEEQSRREPSGSN